MHLKTFFVCAFFYSTINIDVSIVSDDDDNKIRDIYMSKYYGVCAGSSGNQKKKKKKKKNCKRSLEEMQSTDILSSYDGSDLFSNSDLHKEMKDMRISLQFNITRLYDGMKIEFLSLNTKLEGMLRGLQHMHLDSNDANYGSESEDGEDGDGNAADDVNLNLPPPLSPIAIDGKALATNWDVAYNNDPDPE